MNTTIDESKLPLTLTSYSPCFRKEKGAHGIEERGIYRIHQFEKQEMIVICKPEESEAWYEKMWRYTVELFVSMGIPCRQLECCSGDLADLKYRSCDVEAWSPRQKKYFEVGSCSNLGAINSPIPSTIRWSRRRACSSRLSKTTCTPTGAWIFPKSYVPTWEVARRSCPSSEVRLF